MTINISIQDVDQNLHPKITVLVLGDQAVMQLTI